MEIYDTLYVIICLEKRLHS